MGFKSVPVPTHILRDGREFITEQDAVEYPHIAEFVGRFSNYWQHDPSRCGWIAPARETLDD